MHEFVKQVTDQSAVLVLQTTEPSYIASKIAMSKICKLFPTVSKEQNEIIAGLDQSLPGNITLNMGYDLFLLSRKLSSDLSFENKAFYQAFQQGRLGHSFQKAGMILSNFMVIVV